MGAVQPTAGHSETPYARSTVPFSYASVIAPTLIITRTLIEQSRDSRQADRSVSASLFAPSATTAASDGSFATASAFRRSQAVSIVDCRRLLNADAVEPRLDDGQIFDHGDAGPAQEAAAPPEQPGVDGDRKARDVRRLRVERRDAVLVHRRRAWEPPRSLRVNEHLSSGGEHRLRGAGDLLQTPACPARDQSRSAARR